MLEFLDTYGLMLLIGSWPSGPIGGFAGTLILAGLGIAGAFPIALLVGISRTSSCKPIWLLASSWVYLFRSVPLIMIIFWAYFLLPTLIGTEIPPSPPPWQQSLFMSQHF